MRLSSCHSRSSALQIHGVHALKREVNKQSGFRLLNRRAGLRENHTGSQLDVLGLYSSNSAFIGISRNPANDLTDFYATKLE